MKIKFIVKPFSDKKKAQKFQKEIGKFKKELKKKGVKIEEAFTTLDGETNAGNLAKGAIKQGFNRIIFVGGDGLLNEGVNGIMEATGGFCPPDFAIGIIPTGAGNDFTKPLKIPRDTGEAFEVIKKDKVNLVDIGKVNERFFVNVISFGFDAKINKLANDLKEKYQFLPRKGSYLIAALKEIIIKIPLFEVQIKGDGIDFEGEVISVAVTNGSHYGAIFKIAPDALVDDGKFDICFIESVGKLRAFFDIYKIIKGTHASLPEVKMFKASSLEISSPNPLPYEMDGEVLEPKKEYKIIILPKALRVLTP